ncbi:MAG: ATP-dependent 6-phosphofructokinase [Bacteroidota bacterium]
MKKKVLVLTGGGDCPGLNAVIRGIVKRANQEADWEVWGSLEAYNGVMRDPMEVVLLDERAVSGIHVQGGTILNTTTKNSPFSYQVQQADGTWASVDRSDELINRMKSMGINAVISIGGDGSQKISQKLFERGVNVIGVPKTIDNDLSATDFTFGFQTAVQIATESMDKLVTTAASHMRTLIMEVMGRDAGWIALHTAIAAGAEVCLIPEIPYQVEKVIERLNKRYSGGRGFANIVIAEGAKPVDGDVVARQAEERGYENVRLGGVAYQLSQQLKAGGFTADIRETVLGHIQRGGTPTAFDRVLASQFGVKAFELVLEEAFGRMVTYKNNEICSASLVEATESYNYVDIDSFMVQAARGLGISFGD